MALKDESKIESKDQDLNEETAACEPEDTDNAEAIDNDDADKEEQTEDDSDSDDKEEDASGKGSKRKKDKKDKKDKKEKKDPRDAKIEELNDRLLRLMAEYENYRKRTDREKSLMFEMGGKSVIEKIIPVIDNFERGFATVTDEQKEDPFVQGMDKVYKQMTGSLEEAGLKVIEAEGQEFDPNIHEAVMHVEDDSVGENVVVEVLQKGYMYKDTLVRCSMVKVAN